VSSEGSKSGRAKIPVEDFSFKSRKWGGGTQEGSEVVLRVVSIPRRGGWEADGSIVVVVAVVGVVDRGSESLLFTDFFLNVRSGFKMY
jgi:hypothetical protein